MWRSPQIYFCFALFILLPLQCASVALKPSFYEPPKSIGDGPDYENIAFHIWRGDGFVFDNTNEDWRAVYAAHGDVYDVQLNGAPRRLVSTGRPPLLPLMVASVYAVTGRNEWGFAAVRLLLAICLALASAAAVGLTVSLLTRGDHRALPDGIVFAGGATALLLAISQRTLREYATDFLTEPLALVLLQAFVWLVLRLRSGLSSTQALLAGAVFGLLILTRSMFVLWLPAVALISLWAAAGQPWRNRWQATGCLLVAALAVCAPWWLRNVWVLQTWMPLGTQGSITLLGGYDDLALGANGDWLSEPEQRLREEIPFGGSPDLAGDMTLESGTQYEVMLARVAKQRVQAWFLNHLFDLPGLFGKRIYVHWNPYSGRSLLWKLAIICGGLGLLFNRRWEALWLLGLPLTSTLVVGGLYSVGGRFLVPLYGLLFILGGLGVAYLMAAAVKFGRQG